MKSLPVAARIYVVALIAVGVALVAFSTNPVHAGSMPIFLGLGAATVLASMFKLQLPTSKNRATMSIAFVFHFAALLLYGPSAAVLLSVAGALTQSTVNVKRRNPLHRVLFNMAALAISTRMGGLAYTLLGGTIGHLVWPVDGIPLLAAVVSYFLSNSFTIAIVVALSTRQRITQLWQQNFLLGLPSYLIGAAAAVLIAETIARGLWTMLPFVCILAYLTHRAYEAYVGRLEDDHRHRQVIESLNEGMIVVRKDMHVELWNDALERITGISKREVVGLPLTEGVPALAATPLSALIQTAFETEEATAADRLPFEHGGRRRVLQARVFPFAGGATVFLNDITDRAAAEEALRQSEERYALAAAGANDGMWDWDLARDEVYLSARWKTMLGLSPNARIDRPSDWFTRVHPDDVDQMKEALATHIAGHTTHFEHEYRILHEDGTFRRMLCRGVAVRTADGEATRIAGSQTDITERSAVQEQLRHAALHDTLTGLPNRALFTELLSQVLDRSRRHAEQLFAVLFIDVDRFKIVNDSLGHLTGDNLLVSVSRRVEVCLRGGDVLARMGGDEFTILATDLSDAAQASLVALRVQEALRRPFLINGHEIFVSASIGIALGHGGYTRPEDVMRDADTAMYRAKSLGRARYEVFDLSMHARAVDRLSLENDLRRALDHNEFELHYQPIVSLPAQQWTGFEALLRWQRDGKTVSPTEFIPVAEETGMIESLGAWVLREACRQAAQWRARYPNGPVIGITVNVSARQLTRPNFLETVRDAVRSAGLWPGDLRLEITETTLMDNPEQAAHALRELRALGIKVYLDDFGTGFSSLSYLHRFPVDTLKIDRSFVAGLSADANQPAIVESIVALAKTLGTQVIAEGVETEEQRDKLIRLGCGHAQGFLFSEPLSAAAAEAFLAERSGDPEAKQRLAERSLVRVVVLN
jgi:diguanylate cyclase (GGDEF)-like protein/PAS domain S-box-containing protein